MKPKVGDLVLYWHGDTFYKFWGIVAEVGPETARIVSDADSCQIPWSHVKRACITHVCRHYKLVWDYPYKMTRQIIAATRLKYNLPGRQKTTT